MRAVTRLFGLGIAGVVIAGAANAQTCTGRSSLDARSMNVTGAAWFSDGSSAFGGDWNMRHVGWGQNHFVSLGVTTASFDGVDDSQLQFHGALGLEKKISSGLEWCPMVMVGYNKGPGDGLSGLDLGAGVGLGKAIKGGGNMEWVPFGNIGFVHSKTTVDVAGTDVSASDNGAQFGAGIGLRFANGMQISPQFSKTTFTGSKVVFGATVSFPFGKKM